MGEGNFFCKWCGKMKPVSKRKIVYVQGFPEYIGCEECYNRRKK